MYLRSFLGQVERVASKDYSPTPVDILRARLETIGIEEHHIFMETGEKVSFESELTDADSLEVDMGQEWIFYDIEGSRSYKGAVILSYVRILLNNYPLQLLGSLISMMVLRSVGPSNYYVLMVNWHSDIYCLSVLYGQLRSVYAR